MMRIKDWEQADGVLAELSALDRGIDAHETQAANRMARAKIDMVASCEPLLQRREKLEEALERFVRDREDEMDGRSRQLNHGRVWLRKVSAVTARSWKRVLDWLIANRKHDYVRTKYEVNKETLRDAPPELVKACGAKIKDEDHFGYDLNEVAAR